MTQLEIKNTLEDLIYVADIAENEYTANKLKEVLEALKSEWDASEYYYEQIKQQIKQQINE